MRNLNFFLALIVASSSVKCDKVSKKLTSLVEDVGDGRNKCLIDLKYVIDVNSEDAANMFNSWSKFQSNETYANSITFGDFHLCRSIRVEGIYPQYCLIQYEQSQRDLAIFPLPNTSVYNFEWRHINERFGGAVCLPESCSSSDVRKVVEEFFKSRNLTQTIDYDQEHFCKKNSDRFEFNWMLYAVLVITFVTGLVSYIAFFADSSKKTRENSSFAMQLLRCFSFNRNLNNLLNLNHAKTSVTCLNGIKVISIFMIILYHSIQLRFQYPFSDGSLLAMWNESIFVKAMSSLHIFVDPFFIISGALASMSLLRQLENKKFSLIRFYFQRYMRITPVVFVFTIISTTFLELAYQHAPYIFRGGMKEFCSKYWVAIVLHIQTIVNPREICAAPTWYLSADWQMFLISPFIIIAARKMNRTAIISSIFVILTSFLAVRYFVIVDNDYRTADQTVLRDVGGAFEERFYYPIYIRGLAFFCGMILGYLLRTPKISFKSEKFTNILMRSILFLAILFILFFPIPGEYLSTLSSKSIDQLLLTFGRPLWSLCIIIIIYTCHHGYASYLNFILSWKYWIPIAKMALSIYIVAPGPQYMLLGLRYTPIDVQSVLDIILNFVLDVVISFPLAILMYFNIEAPFNRIGKLIAEKFL